MRPVSCSEVDHSLWRYIDRELSASELSAISAHLKECEPCRAQYHEWAREASQYRRVLDETPFGEAFVGRLRHRMRHEGLFASSRRSPLEALSFHRRRVRRIATVAAMLFLIPIVVVVGILSNLPHAELGTFESEGGLVTFVPAGLSGETAAARILKRGDYAAGDAFEVPDGVVVTLRLGSPSRRKDSILTLTGPAFFAIAQDAKKVDFSAHLEAGLCQADVARRALREPFAITTPEARVRVLGTSFDVSALDDRTVLTVRKGVVAFQAIAALPGKDPLEVTPEKGPHVVERGSMRPIPAGEGSPAPGADAAPPPGVRPAPSRGPEPPPAPAPVEPPVPRSGAESAPPRLPGPEGDLDTPVER